ncbi:MAG: autotransporter outer membrane beta-barrel domain-containing protein [Asticcacaulis sp.]
MSVKWAGIRRGAAGFAWTGVSVCQGALLSLCVAVSQSHAEGIGTLSRVGALSQAGAVRGTTPNRPFAQGTRASDPSQDVADWVTSETESQAPEANAPRTPLSGERYVKDGDVSVFAVGGYAEGKGLTEGYLPGMLQQDISSWNWGGGVERQFGVWSLGTALTLAETDITYKQDYEVGIREWGVHLFGGVAGPGEQRPFLDWRIGYGKAKVRTQRIDEAHLEEGRIRGRTEARLLNADVTAGYVTHWKGFLWMTPYLSFSQSYVNLPQFVEKGAVSFGDVPRQTMKGQQWRMGLKLAPRPVHASADWRIRPSLSMAVVSEQSVTSAVYPVFSDLNTSDTAQIIRREEILGDRDWYEAGIGLRVDGPRTHISVSYDREFGRRDMRLAYWNFSVRHRF